MEAIFDIIIILKYNNSQKIFILVQYNLLKSNANVS